MSTSVVLAILVTSLATFLSRFLVVLFFLFIFFIWKRNFVYPTVISAIIMAILSNHM